MLFNNPIGLVSDGKVQEFESLHDFYRRVLELLYHDFPRGRIDYKLFLYDHTMLRGEALGECCKRIERGLEGSADYCISANWTYGVQARNRQYDLIRLMSRHITGACIDLCQFDRAWNQFSKSFNDERQPL